MDALHVPANVTKWDFCMDLGVLDYTNNRSASIDIYT